MILESESEDDERLMILYLLSKKRKKKKVKRIIQRKRESLDGSIYPVKFPDNVFEESFGANRKQFNDVHELIEMDIKNRSPQSTKPCCKHNLIHANANNVVCTRAGSSSRQA